MREIKRYQQTFQCAGGASSYEVQFNRIYKQSPQHKFILRVTNLASYQVAGTNPHLVFAVGMADGIACSYNTQGSVSVSADPYANNDFCLGILGNSASGPVSNWNNNEFITKEIPLNPFTLRYKHLDSAVYDTANIAIAVVFEIIEFKE